MHGVRALVHTHITQNCHTCKTSLLSPVSWRPNQRGLFIYLGSRNTRPSLMPQQISGLSTSVLMKLYQGRACSAMSREQLVLRAVAPLNPINLLVSRVFSNLSTTRWRFYFILSCRDDADLIRLMFSRSGHRLPHSATLYCVCVLVRWRRPSLPSLPVNTASQGCWFFGAILRRICSMMLRISTADLCLVLVAVRICLT